MTDIFQEVEEDVRRERLEKLWKEYGDYIIAGVALLIIAVAGFQLWRVYDQKQRVKASNEFTTAVQMEKGGQTALAAELFGKLAKSAPGGYAALARLQQGDTMLASGNRADGIALLKQIATGSDPDLAAIARIHLAWALVDQESKSEIQSLLAPISAPGSAWGPLAREIFAYADYRAGDQAAAASGFQSLANDSTAPDSLRQRAQVMAQFLKAGGEKNFGTVPAPAQPAKPPNAAVGVVKGPSPK